MRGDEVFVIGELERLDPGGLDSIRERIWAELARFSVSDLPPHFRSIFFFSCQMQSKAEVHNATVSYCSVASLTPNFQTGTGFVLSPLRFLFFFLSASL